MPDFGYAVGDFLAVAKLAWQLYDSCYKVIKQAPGEFLALCNELAALNLALSHVQKDLNRQESKLLQHGEDRLKSLKMMTDNLNLTLLQLDKIVEKYKPVAHKTTSTTIWSKVRWTLEQSNIVKIRLKLTSHVGALNLIVSSIGNSSLGRMECILQRMDSMRLDTQGNEMDMMLESDEAIRDVESPLSSSGNIAKILEIESPELANPQVPATQEAYQHMPSNKTTNSQVANLESTTKGTKTSLHRAAQNGWYSVVEKRLAIEDPNSKDGEGKTPLHLAARKGSESVVKLLLDRGGDQTAEDHSGLTPLHHAIEGGSEEVVNLLSNSSELKLPVSPLWLPLHAAASNGSVQIAKWLLDKKFDSTLQDNDRYTALHIAAREGQDKVVLLLLDYGMDPNAQNNYGQTPLHLAVISERVSTIRILFGHGADPMIQDEDGATALYRAVTRCSISITKLFLDEGIDVNTTGPYGDSVLHTSSYQEAQPDYKVIEMVGFLLRNGALVDTENESGETPLFDAVRSNHLGILSAMLAKGARAEITNYLGDTPLHAAAEIGHIAIARLLLKHKVDLNGAGERKETPLQKAANEGNFEVAKILIQAGSKLTVQDVSGNTPLHSAIYGGCLPLVEFLLDHEADFNAINYCGETPLQYSLSPSVPASISSFDLVDLLLNRGADWNVKDKKGQTALHFAVQKCLKTTKLLLERNQDVNCPDLEGWRPLHQSVRAAILGKALTLEYLLDLHAVDHSVTSNNGQTVLHYLMDWESNVSSDNEKGRRIKLLLKKGVDIDAQDKRGETALHIAARKSSDSLVKLLVESGADLTLTNRDGKTAFDIAAENSRSESIAILLLDGISDTRLQVNLSASSSGDQIEMPARKRLRTTE